MSQCRLDIIAEGKGAYPRSCQLCRLGPCQKPVNAVVGVGGGGVGGVSGLGILAGAGILPPAQPQPMSAEEQAARFLFGVMEDIATVDSIVPDAPIANSAYRDMVREMLAKRLQVGELQPDGSVKLRRPPAET